MTLCRKVSGSFSRRAATNSVLRSVSILENVCTDLEGCVAVAPHSGEVATCLQTTLNTVTSGHGRTSSHASTHQSIVLRSNVQISEPVSSARCLVGSSYPVHPLTIIGATGAVSARRAEAAASVSTGGCAESSYSVLVT